MSVTVYSPASMGNISVGFDLIGAALAPIDGSLLGDKVTITQSDGDMTLTVSGQWADKLPCDRKQNIVYQCAQFFLQNISSDKNKHISLHLEKNLPIGSGLGSSASSVVAALYALNQFFDEPFEPYELLQLMGIFEGKISGSVHYDNVAPSYLGGMQLMIDLPNRICEPLPVFSHWFWIVAYPGISISTAKMRQIMPNQYAKQTCIDFGRNISTFIHACYRNDEKLALSAMKDVLAEPFRASEIPNYQKAHHQLMEMGMATCGISGSGPTLFAVTDDLDLAKNAALWLEKNYLTEQGAFVHICQLDFQGTRKV